MREEKTNRGEGEESANTSRRKNKEQTYGCTHHTDGETSTDFLMQRGGDSNKGVIHFNIAIFQMPAGQTFPLSLYLCSSVEVEKHGAQFGVTGSEGVKMRDGSINL